MRLQKKLFIVELEKIKTFFFYNLNSLSEQWTKIDVIME